MSRLFRYNIPAIGTRGVFSLLTPFITGEGEILECVAVRTISAYIANNDDPLAEVYQAVGLTQDNYDEDLLDNIEIVTLVNDKGYRYLVPGKYIASFPIQDGVYYRPLTITVALPLMPVGQDISPILTDIRELVTSRLGVSSSTSIVEMTEPRAFDRSRSDMVQAERAVVATGTGTAYGQINSLQNLVNDLSVRNQQLEAYILANP